MTQPDPARRWAALLLLAVSLALTAGPLFVGLDRWEMRNDEAIYSYAVQRVLETGEWLTPRSIPSDNPLLEKPPLKIWLVAGAMSLGVLPATDAGMRVLDAIFGALAFGYVFALGRRLAGPLCGAAAMLALFVYEPLVYDHGLRSNNMEAALLLAYAGGLYHAGRWADGDSASRAHVWLAALYFVLGFMTKYVAALFIPVLLVAVVVWRRGGLARLRCASVDWIRPAVAAVGLILPWFIYQAVTRGRVLWEDMFLGQVHQRFVTFVDPRHVEPWHFYLTDTWARLRAADTEWLTAAGLVLLAWRAVARRDAPARLLLVWLAIPLAALSLSSSKITHYLFPFLPPLALAAGLAAATMFDFARWGAGAAENAVSPRLARLGASVPAWLAALATVAGGAAFLAALWTWLVGPIRLRFGDLRILQSASVLRAAVVGTLAFAAAGRVRQGLTALGAIVFLLVLPADAYREQVRRTATTDRPVSALAACLSGAAGPSGGRITVYAADMDRMPHTYFYYLRHVGRWEDAGTELDRHVRRLLAGDGPSSIVLLMQDTWASVRERVGRVPLIDFVDGGVILVPSRFAHCTDAAVAARPGRGAATAGIRR